MSNLQNLATLTGLVGGTSGLIALALESRLIYLNSPRVSCEATWAMDPNDGRQFLNLTVYNRGNQSIDISNIGIRYENGSHTPFTIFEKGQRAGEDLPARLLPHSQLNWYMDWGVAHQGSKINGTKGIIEGYVNLGNGKSKSSKKFHFKSLEIPDESSLS